MHSGKGPRRFRPLSFERFESRALLAALTSISEDDAIALAVNELTATAEGYLLRNPQYNAEFTAQGLRIAPARGGPTWKWQFTGSGVAKMQTGPVSPHSDSPLLVSYDRGGLLEQYLLHGSTVEQQFIVPAPLSAGGDLVIAGEVASTGLLSACDEGWQWNTDDGAVQLGDVTVYDAHGSEIAASMEVTQSSTRILVPAAALQSAAYPLLIDPQIGANDFRISHTVRCSVPGSGI